MTDHKPSTCKLKKILSKKSKVNVSPLQHYQKGSDHQKPNVKNPSRLSSLPSGNPTLHCHQPLSSPVPAVYNRTARTSSISCNTKIPCAIMPPRNKRSHSLHHVTHPGSILLQQQIPPLPTADQHKTSNSPPVKNKRPSVSTSPIHHPQRSRTLLPEEEVVKPSAAAVAAMTSRCKSEVQPPVPLKSRSSPLRSSLKIKTYNVSSKPLGIGFEKKKRQQELEDLISGRRDSTLKLSIATNHTLWT